jgi:hypothetical protein
VEAKQLDEGIGDTFVSVDATSCLRTSDSFNASQMPKPPHTNTKV